MQNEIWWMTHAHYVEQGLPDTGEWSQAEQDFTAEDPVRPAAATKRKDRGLRGYARINTDGTKSPIRVYPRNPRSSSLFLYFGNSKSLRHDTHAHSPSEVCGSMRRRAAHEVPLGKRDQLALAREAKGVKGN